MKKVYTIAIIHKDDRVLLAMKKRGWGEGRWNGYGGKPEEDETLEEAAIREIQEESGVIAKSLLKRGVMEFRWTDKDDIAETHIYEIEDYEGEPEETEEMRPKWFKKDEVPYREMWEADRLWLGYIFEGKNFEGKVLYDGKDKIVETDIRVAEN